MIISNFSSAVLLGLCIGFLWGVGCSLVLAYSVYLAGYRKAIKESLKSAPPTRYTEVFERMQARRARKLAKKKAKQEAAGASDAAPTPEAPAGKIL
jgi:hypothetical protein